MKGIPQSGLLTLDERPPVRWQRESTAGKSTEGGEPVGQEKAEAQQTHRAIHKAVNTNTLRVFPEESPQTWYLMTDVFKVKKLPAQA